MFRRNYFTFLLAIVLFSVGSTTVFAQAGTVRGVVELKKADGTTVPLPDVVIDIYRTDIAGKIPSGKTNKKGEFTILGFLLGGRYALAVSAPNIAADVFLDIKAGDEKLKLTVVEGDGKRFTEEEARKMLANAPKDVPKGELTAEQKKQQEEQAKQLAKYEAEKKKVTNINETVNKSLSEGGKAFNERNYDLALAKYDEGINVDPEFEGSAPVLLNNKAVTLIERAIEKYNAAVKGNPSGKAAALESVKQDLTDSLAASNKSLQILKAASNTDAKAQQGYAVEKNKANSNLLGVYSRMISMNIDTTKGKDALLILEEYSAVETDAAKKSKAQQLLADALSRAGDLENAVIVYRKILETSPENPDALGGLGLSLVGLGSGATPPNTIMMQEGLNLMQRFTEVAPDNHSLKMSVKEAVDYLKTQQLTPQKTPKSTTKKKT